MSNQETKQCWECHSELPKSEFYEDKDFKDGLFPICTYCITEVQEGRRVLDMQVRGLGKYL